jgi:IPT/TIG domain
MSRHVVFSVVFLLLAVAACSEKQDGISVSNIHPRRGPYMGGDPVTISGTGFSATLIDSIHFGKNKARPPVIKENGDIIVEPPAGQVNETVDIEIILNDARAVKIPNAYTYIDPTAKTPVSK